MPAPIMGAGRTSLVDALAGASPRLVNDARERCTRQSPNRSWRLVQRAHAVSGFDPAHCRMLALPFGPS
jgi:hypothetical protein